MLSQADLASPSASRDAQQDQAPSLTRPLQDYHGALSSPSSAAASAPPAFHRPGPDFVGASVVQSFPQQQQQQRPQQFGSEAVAALHEVQLQPGAGSDRQVRAGGAFVDSALFDTSVDTDAELHTGVIYDVDSTGPPIGGQGRGQRPVKKRLTRTAVKVLCALLVFAGVIGVTLAWRAYALANKFKVSR